MVDPTTVNRSLSQPTRGSDLGTWDIPNNGNFGLLDTIVGGVTSIATTGGGTVLNAAQLACGTISVTGALGGSAGLTFPAVQGWWTIQNLTTGNFPLFVGVTGGTESICVPPGEITDIQVNSTTVRYRNLGRIGSYLDYAGASVPSWISSCTIPPYLNCDGSSFSAVTYPVLNAILGGTTLPDIRGTARYTLNQGTNRVTAGGSGVDGNTRFTVGGDQLTQGHIHNVNGSTGNDTPDHTHLLNNGAAFTVGSSSVGNGPSSPGAAGPASVIPPITSGASVRHTHSFNINSSQFGSGGAQNMPPVTISGICMIRAG